MDYIQLVMDMLAGKASVEGVDIKSEGKLNVSIVPIDNGFRVDFQSPEPVVSVVKVIRITDTLDYINVYKNGDIAVKTRSWFSEIPIKLSENS